MESSSPGLQEGRVVRRKAGKEGKSKIVKDLTFRL